jgi:hypothetical protein
MLNAKEFPDHLDAELVLRLYDLRRESVMRESRAAVLAKYLPRTPEEAVAVFERDHPLNAAFRQVVTYWEMAYGMVKWGILHGDFMLESASEGLLLFSRAEPFLDAIRTRHPAYFVNAEWIAKNTDSGRRLMERYRARRAIQLQDG